MEETFKGNISKGGGVDQGTDAITDLMVAMINIGGNDDGNGDDDHVGDDDSGDKDTHNNSIHHTVIPRVEITVSWRFRFFTCASTRWPDQ